MRVHTISFTDENLKAILEGRKTQTRRAIRDGRTDICHYGGVGDKVWVKEKLICDPEGWARYSVDNKKVLIGGSGISDGVSWGWERKSLPAMYMPTYALRTALEITELRVQRLQEISEHDAIAEGIKPHLELNITGWRCAIDDFKDLWESINGKKYPWKNNPWVWAITFRLAEQR